MSNKAAPEAGANSFRPTSKTDQFNAEHGERLQAFLDRNGYTAREVRAIAAMAIAMWATQEG